MSFSKAKVQRFNDIKDCTPSPAKYNVQEKHKPTISKPPKYPKKPGSPLSSDTGSMQSTPCFQTPIVPIKKKKLLGISFKSSKTGDPEELREKIVECINKDFYIKDLTEQIEDMTSKINNLQQENSRLQSNKIDCEKIISTMKKHNAKELDGIIINLRNVNAELREVHKKSQDFKSQHVNSLSMLLGYIEKIQQLHEENVEKNRVKFKTQEEKLIQQHSETIQSIKTQHGEEMQVQEKQIKDLKKHVRERESKMNQTEEILKKQIIEVETSWKLKKDENENQIENLKKQHQEELQEVETKFEEEKMVQRRAYEKQVENLQKQYQEEMKKAERKFEEEAAWNQRLEDSEKQHLQEIKEMAKKLQEKEAKASLLEENFHDVNLLTDLQMKEKINEIEATWKQKLEEKEKEGEAILKECQEIGEYSIIQSEIEKNQIKKLLEEKEEALEKVTEKECELEEEVNNLRNEKHAYELSISTFRDTIEVLKRRLIDSDRDVEQLKEELGKCEEKILHYEQKCTEMTNELNETQIANEELEMQYESTSKLMQNQVEVIEKNLLGKVEMLKKESKQLQKDKEFLNEVLEQNHQQQILIEEAHEAIIKSNILIDSLEERQTELESELEGYKVKLDQEAEEAAEIRKKYIEKSGKYDALAQQFEELLQELDKAKERIQEQKLIDKLMKEIDDLKKSGKKLKMGVEDKENLGSPKRVKGAQSPGPLKNKN